jgi:hypothetical protein
MTVGEAIARLEELSGEHGMKTPFGIHPGALMQNPVTDVVIEEDGGTIWVKRAPDTRPNYQNSPPPKS